MLQSVEEHKMVFFLLNPSSILSDKWSDGQESVDIVHCANEKKVHILYYTELTTAPFMSDFMCMWL